MKTLVTYKRTRTMLSLYYKPTCPYCQRVLGEVEEMGIRINLKDISSDEVLAEELVQKGGKRQVPYLEDTDRGESLYESSDIVEYLTQHYGENGDSKSTPASFGGLKIHQSDDTCESCQ